MGDEVLPLTACPDPDPERSKGEGFSPRPPSLTVVSPTCECRRLRRAREAHRVLRGGRRCRGEQCQQSSRRSHLPPRDRQCVWIEPQRTPRAPRERIQTGRAPPGRAALLRCPLCPLWFNYEVMG